MSESFSEPFKVFHLKSPGDPNLELPTAYWHLHTCLRSIVITEAEGVPNTLKSYDFIQGEMAYEFLLQVICGLDSPLLGETEVLGQFKDFMKKSAGQFPQNVGDVLAKLNRDAKIIRAEYLQNLGCTSYGSLLRKELRGQREPLTIIGAGSLAQDIFPWFAKENYSVLAYTRHPQKYRELAERQPNLYLKAYREASSQQDFAVLVIAAPLTAPQIQSLWDLSRFSKIYDLRGNSQQDALPCRQTVTLQSLFASIEFNKQQAAHTKEKAILAIKEQAGHFGLRERSRPFGWEDLWT